MNRKDKWNCRSVTNGKERNEEKREGSNDERGGRYNRVGRERGIIGRL